MNDRSRSRPATKPELNEAQQRVVAMLGSYGAERPRFAPGIGQSILDELQSLLAPKEDLLQPDGERLFVTKRQLNMVHGCQTQFLAERNAKFEWSTATARGTIAHRAVELLVGWRETPVANLLVDEAIARSTEDSDNLGVWLQGLAESEMAELRNSCTDLIAKFLEGFPPLERRWSPRAESSIRVETGRITFSGRVDLILGRTSGQEAGKVLIDLKTGAPHVSHMDDLRFYALLDTVRTGVPPRMLASYYLDQARPVAEPVTRELLESALLRTVDGTSMMIDLMFGDSAPTLTPGPSCSWCPVLESCEAGRSHMDPD